MGKVRVYILQYIAQVATTPHDILRLVGGLVEKLFLHLDEPLADNFSASHDAPP